MRLRPSSIRPILAEIGGIERPAWQESALCAQVGDPDKWFPDASQPTRAARDVCKACEVREPCLEVALENDERYGLWGGLDANQRARLKGRAR